MAYQRAKRLFGDATEAELRPIVMEFLLEAKRRKVEMGTPAPQLAMQQQPAPSPQAMDANALGLQGLTPVMQK